MKTHGLNIFVLLVIAILFSISCIEKEKSIMMTATSNSDEALKIYREAYQKAYKVIELDEAVRIYEKAINEDPDFFMAYYQLATYHLFHKNISEFEKNALSAINCDINWSKGEEIQKKALKAWLEDQNTDNTELGLELVKLYPNDPDALFNLGFYYYITEDYENAIEAFEKAPSQIDIESDYCGPKLAIVPICMLGYSYLIAEQLEQAKTSYDTYIELFPDEQNPYDCKADYFIKIEDYKQAFESYMKAYEIDTNFHVFRDRALNVKKYISEDFKSNLN